MPLADTTPRWRDTLASLQVPNFRLYTFSNILAMSATAMQRIALDWLVFELTHSVAAVGLTVAFQSLPMLLFGLWGGVLVDRYSKRMLMMCTQSTAGGLSALLAVLAMTEVIAVWHVYTVALIVGFVTVIDYPTRQVLVNEIVGPRHLKNAISVNSSVFQLGGLIGPAVASILMLGGGAGWAFAVNALACAATVVTLLQLRTSALIRIPPIPRAKGQLRQGIRYSLGKPVILWPLVMLAFLSVFSLNMPVILTAYATEVFSLGVGGYGLFNSLVATGSLVGALASTRASSVRLRGVILAGGAWGLLQATAGLMSDVISFGTILILQGFACLLFFTAANSLVQLSSNLGVRGRVMSLYVLVTFGGQAIGGPLMGWVVDRFGPHTGLVISGLVPAMAAVTIGVILARRGQLRIRVSLRHSWSILVIEPQARKTRRHSRGSFPNRVTGFGVDHVTMKPLTIASPKPPRRAGAQESPLRRAPEEAIPSPKSLRHSQTGDPRGVEGSPTAQ